jgi:predicted kinase
MDGSDRCHVVAVEGHSGARKSFFAGHLAAAPGVEVINSDDLVPGWSGWSE